MCSAPVDYARLLSKPLIAKRPLEGMSRWSDTLVSKCSVPLAITLLRWPAIEEAPSIRPALTSQVEV